MCQISLSRGSELVEPLNLAAGLGVVGWYLSETLLPEVWAPLVSLFSYTFAACVVVCAKYDGQSGCAAAVVSEAEHIPLPEAGMASWAALAGVLGYVGVTSAAVLLLPRAPAILSSVVTNFALVSYKAALVAHTLGSSHHMPHSSVPIRPVGYVAFGP